MRSIKLAPNGTGKFTTWEKYGHKGSNTNSKNIQLITDSNFNKKQPVYVPKVVEPYGNQALYEIEKGDILVQYNYEPKAYTVISLYNSVVLTNYMDHAEYFEMKPRMKFNLDLYSEYAKGILAVPDKRFISIKHDNKWLLVNTKYYDYVEIYKNDIEFIDNYAICAKLDYKNVPDEIKEAVNEKAKPKYGLVYVK